MPHEHHEPSSALRHPVDAVWDAGGLGCGELVIELRNRLKAMPGRTLRLVALDPGAPEDIPAWCRMTGHELVGQELATCSYWIRARGEPVGAAADSTAGAAKDGSIGLDDVYSPLVFALARSLPPASTLPRPDATATAHSKVCGSKIAVDLAIADGVVRAYAQRVDACLFGRATAALVARTIVGTPTSELRQASLSMREMLAGGPVPGGRWSELAALAPMRILEARRASALLVFTAIDNALDGLASRS